MKRRVIGVFTAAVLSLATAGVALATPAVADTSANGSECHSGVVPAAQAGQSNLRLECVLVPLDQNARTQLSDYPFARWHAGSARNVTATVSNATTGVLTGAAATFLAGDVGHTVTQTGTCAAVPARAFIVSQTGTTATLNSHTGLKPGVRTPATIASVTTTTGQAILVAPGTTAANSFQACDVGRVITGGAGIPAGAKIASFISAKLATLSAAATATSAATTRNLATLNLVFQINNTRSRNVQDATITSGSTALTSAAAHFVNSAQPAGDVGNVVGGQCIPDGTTIVSVAVNVATLSAAATCTQATGDTANQKDLTIELPDGATSTARIVTDSTVVLGKFHSPTANFLPTDRGTKIVKAGVAYLITTTTATDATVTPVPANNATPATIQVGNPTATSPTNGDLVAQQATALELQTSLVAGSHPCGTGHITGTTIDGAWYNPGAFLTTGILGTSGAGVPKVQDAEIVFPTSVTSFAAFVTPRGANAVDETGHTESQTAAHTDITFPFEPLGIAVCATTSVAVDFNFIGTSLGTQKLATGTGQPSTGLVRGIQQVTGGATPAEDTFITLGGGTGVNPDLAGDTCSINPAFALTTFATAFPCGT